MRYGSRETGISSQNLAGLERPTGSAKCLPSDRVASVNEPVATIDFETRSACNIKRAGAWRYSIDPTTEVLCLAYQLPHWPEGKTALWYPPFFHLGIDARYECDLDMLGELVDWIDIGKPIEAHNAWFERSIWTNILMPQHGFPPIHPTQWRCSAAKAASHALPRGLDDAVTAMRLSVKKDMEGHRLMMKMSKPRKSRKAERLAWDKAGVPHPKLLWHESRVLFERLWAYCRQDVLAEANLSAALPDLSSEEQAVYVMDQTINERGFALDPQAVTVALSLIEKETRRLNARLNTITGGVVTKATKRVQLREWLACEGVEIPDTTKATVRDTLTDPGLPSIAQDALKVLEELGQSSTAKYQTMQAQICPDNRVRGGLLYHGATTGRWSGSGVQPHNFPRGTIKDMEGLWASLKTPGAALPYSVMASLSQGLRGAIVAGPGTELFVGDYAAIEARVVLWLAQQEDGLELFRQDKDIYLDMASEIYGYECSKATHPQERQVGKTAILGLGYQMGWSKFQATCETMAGVSLDDEMAQRVVETYREKFAHVKQLWWDQEAAAIKATNGRKPVVCGYVTWQRKHGFLYCELPSGRTLAYPNPIVREKETPWGEMRPQLTYMGVGKHAHAWGRQATYGGMLVENITQAVARDVMAEAMVRLEASKVYAVVLSVHDEILAEAPLGAGTVKEFEALMTASPDWAEGLPIKVEGFVTQRYRK